MICPGIEQELTSGGILSYISHIDTCRKIPKISPRAYIYQRPFLRDLFLEELIFKGACTQREICISKLIGLAYSWNKIYVSNLHKVFTDRTRCEDMDLINTQPCKLKTQPQIDLLKHNTRF